MIRTKLVEAREKRGWTQEKAACELGIDVVTLHRWEHGVCKPRGYNKQRLIKVYEASAYELGLEGIGPSPEQGQTSIVGNNLLETRLLTLILQWPRNRLDYDELRRNLRQEIEESMTSEINRRRALELLATLPISVFSLSSERPVPFAEEEAMPWLTGGITACWYLSRGSDLSLASSLVSSYIPTLKSLTQQPRYRKTTSDLAAQAYLLKATLGWHLSTPQDAISYAQEAKNYAEIAQNYLLQVDALHRQGMAFYYLKRYDQAVQKLEEARYLVEHQKVPGTQARHLYLSLATYQAASGDTDDAKISMKKAQKYYVQPQMTQSLRC